MCSGQKWKDKVCSITKEWNLKDNAIFPLHKTQFSELYIINREELGLWHHMIYVKSPSSRAENNA